MRFSSLNAGPSRRWMLTTALALVLGLVLVGPARAGDLNMVSVGVSKFKNNYVNALGSPHKDAVGMTKIFQAQKGKLFNQVNVTQLLNEQATSGNILAAVNGLRNRANSNSYTILFVATHGGTSNGQYSFCAHDQTVSWSSIQAALGGLPGRVIVILDTCGSGGVTFGGNMIVFSACLSTQVSGENNAHGFFTQAFLEALSGKADMNKDGKISLSEVDAYVSGKLDTYNKGKQPKDFQQCTMLRPTNVPSALTIAFVTGGTSVATNPVTTPATNPVTTPAVPTGSTKWQGSETLAGFGKLTFVFQPGNQVTMYDVQKSYTGTWTKQGNRIIINLPSIGTSYDGVINGVTYSGQGKDSKGSWTFSVNHTK